MSNKIDKLKTDADPIHAESNVQQEKKLRFMGSMMLQSGQKMWELDLETNKLQEAVVHKEVIMVKGKPVEKRKIITKKYAIYQPAINMKNAARKCYKAVQQCAFLDNELGRLCRELIVKINLENR